MTTGMHLGAKSCKHVPESFPKAGDTKGQLYMSTTLWHLVEDRKEALSRLRGLQKTRSRRFLAGLFALWRGDIGTWHELYFEDVMADQVYAHDLRQFECLSRRFLDVRKMERKAWYAHCAQHLQDGLSRSVSLSQWFKLLRPKRAIKYKTQPASRLPGVCTDAGEWLTRGKALSIMWQRHLDRLKMLKMDVLRTYWLDPNLPTRRSRWIYALGPTDPVRPGTFHNAWCQPPGRRLDRIKLEQKFGGPTIPGNARRCFALFLKSGLRQQWVAEFAGGEPYPIVQKG